MRLPPRPTPWRIVPGILAGVVGTALSYTALTRSDWVALPVGLVLLGLGVYLVGVPIAQAMLVLRAYRRRPGR
ncbi:MAG: hypothetical protein M0Z66_02370 [Thermaerobacter sp.]|nr:hypothetical protein [Thermaerobacter sp.]